MAAHEFATSIEWSGAKQGELSAPGLPGFEVSSPPGFHTTAHAGEAAGADSIWGAIKELEVDRIEHGTHAIDDPRLLAHLGEYRIPVECCPISNLRTGVVKLIEEHPIRKFYDDGLLVSVNTDDPKMFNTSLVEEYRLLADKLAFEQNDIIKLVENAIRSSWAGEERKEEILRELREAG